LLALALLGMGILLGAQIALIQVYGYRSLRWFCRRYEQMFRAVPSIVLVGS